MRIITGEKEGQTMRTINRLISTAVMALLVGVFSAAVATASTLTIAKKEGVGGYLVDEKGMTLYIFTKDAPNKSVCGAANGCLEKWPLFYVPAVEPGSGYDPASFGTIIREDGLKQTTYRGQPLYYFFKDKERGDIKGQGVNNVWFVVTP